MDESKDMLRSWGMSIGERPQLEFKRPLRSFEVQMTKQEYMKFHKEMCDKMVAITESKNQDYTGITQDPFANFRACEHMGVASTCQGFLTRMLDKIARVNSFAQRGTLSVKTESVLDTLMDLANYSILMAGFIKSETENNDVVWGDPEFVYKNEEKK